MSKDIIQPWLASGWSIKDETPDTYIVKKNEASFLGHFLVFFFFGWWSLGIANFIYWQAKKKVKRIPK